MKLIETELHCRKFFFTNDLRCFRVIWMCLKKL